MRTLAPALVVLASACSSPEVTEVTWIRSWSADWAAFNHRLAYLSLHPSGEGVEAAFIGGASTTGRSFDDSGTCIDSTTCWELEFHDQGLLTADVQSATSEEVVFAHGEGRLTVGAEGGRGAVEVALPRDAHGAPRAWIAGFTIDATEPLPAGAPSCYDPRHGWLPTRIRLSLGEPILVADDLVEVPVEATFASGASLEDQRACLDAVIEDARATFTVQVAVLVGEVSGTEHTVQGQAVWPDRAAGQSPEVLGDVSVDLAPEAIIGWTSWDFRTHEVVEPGRGAYLRTLQVEADPASDVAFGFASNTSPVTQLSGFDYRFEGTFLELHADGVETTSRAFSADALEPLLEDDGTPVLQVLTPR